MARILQWPVDTVCAQRSHEINYQMHVEQRQNNREQNHSNIFQSWADVGVNVDIVCSDSSFVNNHFDAMCASHCTSIHIHAQALFPLEKKSLFRDICMKTVQIKLKRWAAQWQIREIILTHAFTPNRVDEDWENSNSKRNWREKEHIRTFSIRNLFGDHSVSHCNTSFIFTWFGRTNSGASTHFPNFHASTHQKVLLSANTFHHL